MKRENLTYAILTAGILGITLLTGCNNKQTGAETPAATTKTASTGGYEQGREMKTTLNITWRDYKLKGRVNSLKEVEYEVGADGAKKEGTSQSKYSQFNTHGLITTEVAMLNDDKSSADTYSYTYDSAGTGLQRKVYASAKGGSWIEDYTCNAKGQVETSVKKGMGPGGSKSVFTYNADGTLSKQELEMGDESETLKSVVKFDAKGMPTEATTTGSKGQKGNLTGSWDESGKVLTVKGSETDGTNSRDYKFVTTFDDNDNEVKMEYQMAKSAKTMECKYELDNKGNWIKKTTTENGQVTKIAERTISYY